MIYARHRTAANGLETWWHYDAVRRTVLIVIQRGPAIAVEVCSPERPRFGAYQITQLDPTTWCIAPAMYTSPRVGIALVAEGHSIDDRFDHDSVALTNTPEEISNELLALADSPIKTQVDALNPPAFPIEEAPPENEEERQRRRSTPTFVTCACCKGRGRISVEEFKRWTRKPDVEPVDPRS